MVDPIAYWDDTALAAVDVVRWAGSLALDSVDGRDWEVRNVVGLAVDHALDSTGADAAEDGEDSTDEHGEDTPEDHPGAAYSAACSAACSALDFAYRPLWQSALRAKSGLLPVPIRRLG